MFRNILKNNIKDKLIRSEIALETILILILDLIRLNNILYDRKIENKYDYYYNKKGYLGNREFLKALE
jgi:hypothetical protein